MKQLSASVADFAVFRWFAKESWSTMNDLVSTMSGLTSDAFIAVDQEHNIIFFNQGAETIFGYSASEAVGKALDVLLPERWTVAQRSRLLAFVSELEQTQPLGKRQKLSLRRKDGSRFTAEGSIGRALKNEQVIHIVILRDISQRKAAERALRESNRQSQAILLAIPDLMFRLSRDGVFQDFKTDTIGSFKGFPEVKVGKPLSDFFPVGLAELTKRQIAIALEVGSINEFEFQLTILETLRYYEARLAACGSDEVVMIVRDISDRRLSDKRIASHALLLDNVSDAVISCDLQMRVESFNLAAEVLYGWTPEEAIGRDVRDLLGVEYNIIDRTTVPDALRMTGKWDGELVHHARDGCRIDVEARISLVRDENGNAVSSVNIVRDITKRKRAEERDRYQLLVLENVSDAIVSCDAEFRVMSFNRAAEAMYGWKAEEVMGRTFREFLEPDYGSLSREQVLNDYLANGKWFGEVTLRHRDGHRIRVESRNTLIRDVSGNPMMLVNINRDITKPKQAEEQLIYHSLVLDHANDAVISSNIQFRMQSFNKAAEDLFGWTASEALGREFREFLQPDYSPITREQALEDLFANGNWAGELTLQHKDGHRIQVEMRIARVNDALENPVTVVSIIRDITERRRSEANIQSQLHRLAALRSIDSAITGSVDLELTLNVVLEQAIKQLGVDAADVLLLNPATNAFTHSVSRGFRSQNIQQTRVPLPNIEQAQLNLDVMHIHNPCSSSEFSRAALLSDEHFVELYSTPLIVKGKIIGILEVFNRQAFKADQDWLTFMQTLAGQAAIAVDNAGMFQQLARSNADLVLAYDSTIEALSRAIDLRDKDTEGHTLRVTAMTEQLVKAMGMDREEQLNARRGSLLHDIGKLSVPDSILFKAGELTAEERHIMRRHPQYAYDMLSPIEYLRPALDIPTYHHEKWDGTGYPLGLKGNQIPVAVRLFSVVDVWDALRSDRPYRKGWPDQKVYEYLRAESGTFFDPNAVQLFFQVLASES